MVSASGRYQRHDAMNGLGDSTRSADPITRHAPFTEGRKRKKLKTSPMRLVSSP
jgi:hypothetical protein